MKCVLISGASGAVGSALAPLFLSEKNCEVKILLRADSESHLQRRADSLFQFWGLGTTFSARLAPLRGDVTLPEWGVPGDVYRQLTRTVTHIIHSAGNVRLNEPLETARRSAVDSARYAVELARACQANGQFQKLEFVSTVGVAGKTPGLIVERPYSEVEEFHNTYEQAKAEAEGLMLSEMAAGLPATVHRPSMVVGDSATGKIIHFQVFYFLTDFLAGLKTKGFVPAMGDAKLDIIPADYVAHAIYIAHKDAESVGKIFHLCTGPEESWRLADLTTHLREMLRRRGQRIPRLRLAPLRVFRASIFAAATFAMRKNRRFLRSLPFFLDYLEENQMFDNKVASDFLVRRGLRAPRVVDYLDRIMEVYWASKPGDSR
jgi:thioester reductase-like protein